MGGAEGLFRGKWGGCCVGQTRRGKNLRAGGVCGGLGSGKEAVGRVGGGD